MNATQRRQLAALCPTVSWEAHMAAYSTFRAGGLVEALVEVHREEELPPLLHWLGQQDIPWQVIGGGSNILVATRRQEGVFLRLRGSVRDALLTPSTDGDDCALVRVPAGCSLAALVGWCSKQGLAGMSFMAGIPGTVGGAVRMNAGAFGHAIGERLHGLRCVDARGEWHDIAAEAIRFAYRSTRLPGEEQSPLLITTVELRLGYGDQQSIARECRDIITRRKQKQPQGVASAGSFFKNPAGDFAGRLIESAGLKGLAQGKAMVSPKHANFIVNTGGAEPSDIVLLMEKVREKVWLQSGVLLEPEVRIL